jgi:hypothetical protein
LATYKNTHYKHANPIQNFIFFKLKKNPKKNLFVRVVAPKTISHFGGHSFPQADFASLATLFQGTLLKL